MDVATDSARRLRCPIQLHVARAHAPFRGFFPVSAHHAWASRSSGTKVKHECILVQLPFLHIRATLKFQGGELVESFFCCHLVCVARGLSGGYFCSDDEGGNLPTRRRTHLCHIWVRPLFFTL